MSFRVLLLSFAIAQLYVGNGSEGGPPSVQGERFTSALQELDRKAEGIRDLTADFTQLKHTALLKKPMESKGTLRIKMDGDKTIMRWDTTTPHPSSMSIADGELRIYYSRQSLLEIYPLEQGLGQVAASPVPRLENIRQQFTIEEYSWENLDAAVAKEHLALRLKPIDETLREHVLEVRLLIDKQIACIIAAEIVYPDHERLVLSFRNIRLNSGVKDRDLELNIPAGTTVTRPLEPKAKSGAS